MIAMPSAKRFASHSFYPLIIVASLLAGRLVPAFYDWTGSDQSRPSPWIGRTALVVLVCGFVVCLILPWVPMHEKKVATLRVSTSQFKIRSILIMTALVAVLLVALRKTPTLAASSGMYIIALGYIARMWIYNPALRIQTIALLACMYFPYAWLISTDSFSTLQPAMLGMASGLPSFLLSVPVGRLLGYHFQELAWMAILMASAELMLGAWLIQLGPRRFVAFLVVVFTASLFGSFCINALVRM